MQLLIKEENFAGKILDEILLDIESKSLTLKELIQKKIAQNISHQNQKIQIEQKQYENEFEQKLNPNHKAWEKKKLDTEKEVYRALEVFNNNGFLVMVDNRQITDLEEEILVFDDTQVSFIRLTQLVGG